MNEMNELHKISILQAFIEEAKYLFDVFIEGGYAEEEDVVHLDRFARLSKQIEEEGLL